MAWNLSKRKYQKGFFKMFHSVARSFLAYYNNNNNTVTNSSKKILNMSIAYNGINLRIQDIYECLCILFKVSHNYSKSELHGISSYHLVLPLLHVAS